MSTPIRSAAQDAAYAHAAHQAGHGTGRLAEHDADTEPIDGATSDDEPAAEADGEKGAVLGGGFAGIVRLLTTHAPTAITTIGDIHTAISAAMLVNTLTTEPRSPVDAIDWAALRDEPSSGADGAPQAAPGASPASGTLLDRIVSVRR
jgi:hypothetical protein